jgi:hypothetical protein
MTPDSSGSLTTLTGSGVPIVEPIGATLAPQSSSSVAESIVACVPALNRVAR